MCACLQEGEYKFPLEAVKMLWQVLEEAKNEEANSNAVGSTSAPAVCSHPHLPDDFRALCHDPNAEEAFANLGGPTVYLLSCLSARACLSVIKVSILKWMNTVGSVFLPAFHNTLV